ncbi:metal ABC transporter ATP-binding protein [Bordetella avium]|uniref:Cation ABC transporter, ATP-binding protein n=1 Tax=Bordetella avium (strain 197N) TaxID=360910 RepID=Q2L353_BORA1|nr:metal ABC transporter ATP-binding protein [Bordetella avium]AZY47821.1 metal ABC transporter ATP-binding protein [Bordetella avium]RIQ18556.1 metal ABC transporter ATP-binding protein [Bordetella avium]RIQ35407.1 metal ABC transporter ATP-binding protein [Bordetella avium]RIQ53808.1 metal ABC transporter ATP-binding protein [Bordetella avium]RIQ72240.1 metal ABC transporter ATP-binding protein [Bordetella avium]
MGHVVTPAAIELESVTFGWRGQPAVRDVSGRFAPGCMTAIIGPNGAGKSTLVKGLAGVLAPMSGRLHRDSTSVAWLPQAAELDRDFPICVLDAVVLGGWRRIGALRAVDGDETARARLALRRVGLEQLAERPLQALSGGQLQRVLFARLLMQDAPVLVLDEPFAAVDGQTTRVLMALLCALQAEGRSIIAVLHDMALVKEYFAQALLLSGRVLAWGPTADVLSPERLAHGQLHLGYA